MTELGHFSPTKAAFYEYLQKAKETPDHVLTGGPLDKIHRKANKSKHDLMVMIKQAIYDDKALAEIDAVMVRVEQREMQSPDYQLLDLSNHEGRLLKKDVRNAYRRQARKLHPDVGGTDEAFQELHAAYRRVLASVPKE